jgi:hypothetical protein
MPYLAFGLTVTEAPFAVVYDGAAEELAVPGLWALDDPAALGDPPRAAGSDA